MRNIRFIKTLLFIFIFIIYLLIPSGWIDSIDGMQYVTLSRNIAYYSKITMPDQNINTSMYLILGRDNNLYSFAGLGWTLILLPFAYLSKLVYIITKTIPATYFPLQSDYLLTFLSSFVNPILGFGLFYSIYKIARNFKINFLNAFFIAVSFSLTTNLLPLAKHSFAHLPMIFVFSISFLNFQSYIHLRQRKNLILSGLFFGFAVITYNYSFLLIPFSILITVFFDYFLYKNRYIKINKSILQNICIFVLSTLPFILLMFFYNFYRFGNILNTGYSMSGGDFVYKGVLLDGIYGLWLSVGKGMLIYSPIMIIVILTSYINFRTSYFARLFAFISVIYTLFYGRLFFWSGELSYGPRYIAPLIFFGALVLIDKWKTVNKKWFIILSLAGIYVQLVGITIPYQTQYPPYNSNVYSIKPPYYRNDLFDYWAIGEFIPKFSPPYRLKRILLNHILNIPSLLFKSNRVELAQNISPPILKQSPIYLSNAQDYKHLFSNFWLYSSAELQIRKFSFELSSLQNQPTTYKLCSDKRCYIGEIKKGKGRVYELLIREPILVRSKSYFSIVFNPLEKGRESFQLDMNSYSINEDKYAINTYRMVCTDNLFWSNKKYLKLRDKDLTSYWQLRNEFHSIVNSTPDYWWIKSHIFFNLPDIFRSVFYLLVFVGVIIAILLCFLLLLKLKKLKH